MPGSDRHSWPFRIQQSGTMHFPSDPFVSVHKHRDSAVCKRQEAVRDPYDNVCASAASLDEHWCTIAQAWLNVIESNTIHQPRDDSLNKLGHRTQPKHTRRLPDGLQKAASGVPSTLIW